MLDWLFVNVLPWVLLTLMPFAALGYGMMAWTVTDPHRFQDRQDRD